MLILGIICFVIVFTIAVLIAIHLVVSGVNTFTTALSVPTPRSILPQIIDALDLPEHGEYLEPGCGDARVLGYVLRSRPNMRAIGIENDPIALTIARLRIHGRAQLIQGNLLHVSFERADRVFMYLSPRLMKSLESRLERELPHGSRLVSLQFPLLGRAATEERPLVHGKRHAQRIYIYDY
jgi:SAM-dependent methyltransferase